MKQKTETNPIVAGLPPVAKRGQLVTMDFEMFDQIKDKLHRPNGSFALISTKLQGDPIIYQLYDQKDLRKLVQVVRAGTWTFHNALYDLRQFRRYATVAPRYIVDTMLIEQAMNGGLYQNFGLADLTRRYLNKQMEKETREHFYQKRDIDDQMKRYAAIDVINTEEIALLQLAKYENDPGWKAYTQADEPMIFPVLDLQGFRVDVKGWEIMVKEFARHGKEIEDEIDVNVYSSAKVKDILRKQYKINIDSTANEILVSLLEDATGEAKRFIEKVISARMYRKASSTYGMKWLEQHVEEDGKVYSDYKITGADKTGRMSCVSGSTLLPTSRGTFRFDDYVPQAGDRVMTHEGRWMPVIRKIFKGYEPMYLLELDNGSSVQCTSKHRILTADGWKEVGELQLNKEVMSYVSIEGIHIQEGEHCGGLDVVFGGRTEARHSRDSQRIGDYLSQRQMDYSQSHRWREETTGKGVENVSLKNGRQEPYVGQEWFAASAFQGTGRRWAWLPKTKGWGQVRVGASQSDGRDARTGDPAELVGCASYRRGQDQQRSRQFGVSNGIGSQQVTFQKATITKITPLGTMGVWDIEVTGDHSYLSQGFINHNSSGPNMQNIPQRKLPEYRKRFLASKGSVIGVWDVHQQEPGITAYHSQDRNLIDAIKAGEDLHLAVARAIYDNPALTKADKMERGYGKAINLGLTYGLTANGLSRRTGLTVEQANNMILKYFRKFSGVHSYIQSQRRNAFRDWYVTTALGRRSYLNLYDHKWENNAINSPIQGGAADMTKIWGRKTWEKENAHKLPHTTVAFVHDETVDDTPKEITRERAPLVKDAFQETAEFLYKNIPMKVEYEFGNTWAAKSIEAERISLDFEEGDE